MFHNNKCMGYLYLDFHDVQEKLHQKSMFDFFGVSHNMAPSSYKLVYKPQ